MPPTAKQTRLATERAGALADPTRLSIALLLREAEPAAMKVTRLAEEIGRDVSLVSRHCARLRQAGLIRTGESVRHGYRITPSGAALADAVMREP